MLPETTYNIKLLVDLMVSTDLIRSVASVGHLNRGENFFKFEFTIRTCLGQETGFHKWRLVVMSNLWIQVYLYELVYHWNKNLSNIFILVGSNQIFSSVAINPTGDCI